MSQPDPIRNDSQYLWPQVVRDMMTRDMIGAERYSTRLQALNGRDMAQDAYEEALDMSVYLKGVCVEMEALRAERDSLLDRESAHLDRIADLEDGNRKLKQHMQTMINRNHSDQMANRYRRKPWWWPF